LRSHDDRAHGHDRFDGGSAGGGHRAVLRHHVHPLQREGVGALKKGEKPADGDVFFEVNPLFREVAQAE
jgi:hypothetical protein